MRLTLTTLIRLAALAGLGLGTLAVGVGRLVPPEAPIRVPATPAGVLVNPYTCGPAGPAPRWLDPETGRVFEMALPEGDRLDLASCAPWRDEDGGTQVAGRWFRLGGEAGEAAFGLARFRFPDGRLVDRVELDMMPSGAPCWSPEPRARLVFAAGDGRLYRLDLEGEDGGPRPIRLAWKGGASGLERALVTDPSWPRIGGRDDLIVASLSVLEAGPDGWRYRAPRVWWLRLGRGATSVIAAGPVTGDDGRARRYPTVVAEGAAGWRLLTVGELRPGKGRALLSEALEFDTRCGTPRVAAGPARVLAEGLCQSPPSVSADGRWAAAMIRGSAGARPCRVPLTGGAEAGPVRGAGSARSGGPVR